MINHLQAYHKSINNELTATKDRVRSLLHPSINWSDDGRHKESILKNVLERHLPETIGIYSGYVKLDTQCTSQIDILLSEKARASLFKSQDFLITTPSSVFAGIEVKTKPDATSLKEALIKIANNAEMVRQGQLTANAQVSGVFHRIETNPWFGLFAFEDFGVSNEAILSAFNDVANRSFKRVIQCACIGPNKFVRFWSSKRDDPRTNENEFTGWELYEMPGLAFSYFISNIVWQDQPGSIDSNPWFALGSKNPYKVLSQKFTYQP